LPNVGFVSVTDPGCKIEAMIEKEQRPQTIKVQWLTRSANVDVDFAITIYYENWKYRRPS